MDVVPVAKRWIAEAVTAFFVLYSVVRAATQGESYWIMVSIGLGVVLASHCMYKRNFIRQQGDPERSGA